MMERFLWSGFLRDLATGVGLGGGGSRIFGNCTGEVFWGDLGLLSENCNPGWTAEPLKSHRFVLLPPEKGASALMDKKTQSVHD